MSEFTENTPTFTKSSAKVTAGLHLVSTPIGAARDITLRALDILAGADVLAAEDTRTLRHLMEIHGIALNGRPLIAVHDHNEREAAVRVVRALAEGKAVAYASEAGTPLISDPGFVLARAAVAENLPVWAAPGASAVLAALAVAGLPTDRFMFAGFVPQAQGERARFLTDLSGIEATLVVYESPRRIRKTLAAMREIFGAEHPVALCRELTKRHEQVLRGSVEEVLTVLGEDDPKGEIVLVIGRGEAKVASAETIETALDQALTTMSVKEAAAFVAQTFDMARRDIYQMALARKSRAE